MKIFKNGFTMIELVFVIVVLGILAAVSIPKFSSVTDDANFTQGMATISSIRSSIANERQSKILKGIFSYPEILDDALANVNHDTIFDGNATISILQYPVYTRDTTDTSGWMKTTVNGAVTTYQFCINSNKCVDFNYTKATGIFDCDHSNQYCKEMTE